MQPKANETEDEEISKAELPALLYDALRDMALAYVGTPRYPDESQTNARSQAALKAGFAIGAYQRLMQSNKLSD